MNKWKVSFWISLLVLVASNIFWIYSNLNTFVDQTQQQKTLDDQEKYIKAISIFAVRGAKDCPKDQFVSILKQVDPTADVSQDSDTIDYAGGKFFFENNILQEVTRYK